MSVTTTCRAGVADDGDGHDADGAGAGDEHVLTKYRKRERCVHGVAEGIEDGRHFLVDLGIVAPDVGHGQGDVLGKTARPVHAHALRLRAQVPSACKAVAAAPADHVALAADNVAGVEVVYVGANSGNLADEFMANYHGHRDGALGPFVPLEDMHVSSADAGVADAHQHVIDADGRFRNVLQP
jgi:hypothetical protein